MKKNKKWIQIIYALAVLLLFHLLIFQKSLQKRYHHHLNFTPQALSNRLNLVLLDVY